MRGHHRGGRGVEEKLSRLLRHGDLRYVILFLLEEKPRHGYELIKALEDLSSGVYTPSPGVIYPTLTFLEEGGFATATTEDNKKLYKITSEGKTLVKENIAFVKEILSRFAMAGQRVSRLRQEMGREDMMDVASRETSPIRRAMHAFKAELFLFIDANKETKLKVAEVIDRATEEIRKLKG
ncbi:PadR family transcriptional regulator [Bdellovibrio sp. NC01]|nr:PadR family transcriptional regulator [Bdellovibrio sp. NC01]